MKITKEMLQSGTALKLAIASFKKNCEEKASKDKISELTAYIFQCLRDSSVYFHYTLETLQWDDNTTGQHSVQDVGTFNGMKVYNVFTDESEFEKFKAIDPEKDKYTSQGNNLIYMEFNDVAMNAILDDEIQMVIVNPAGKAFYLDREDLETIQALAALIDHDD